MVLLPACQHVASLGMCTKPFIPWQIDLPTWCTMSKVACQNDSVPGSHRLHPVLPNVTPGPSYTQNLYTLKLLSTFVLSMLHGSFGSVSFGRLVICINPSRAS